MPSPKRLDLIYLFTGDGDFVSVVNMVQNKGCRVELVAFANVSMACGGKWTCSSPATGFRGSCPRPAAHAGASTWGETGQPGPGRLHQFFLERSYGFFRFMHAFGQLWITDTRLEESPYTSVFFMEKDLPPGVPPEHLPSRDYILEFTLTEGDKGFVASDIELVYKY